MGVEILRNKVKAWGNVKLSLLRQQISGITAIKYEKDSEKETLYGAGREPIDVGIGNNKYTGSITMYRYEVNRILNGLPDGADLTDIASFPITVMAVFENGFGKETDTIIAQFTKMGRDIKQGDKMDMVELPLLVTGIKFGAPAA